MAKKTWTAFADTRTEGGLHQRGLLIGSYETAADADQNFGSPVGLTPVAVVPGLQWSTTAEELVSPDASNALMCKHRPREHDALLCVRVDLPS